jgi:HD-GYP domain-containing protein (c-di-GMP phosphodiesterase class II)
VRSIPAAAALEPGRPTVVVIDCHAWEDHAALAAIAESVAVVARGSSPDDEPPAEFLTAYIPANAPRAAVATQLRGAFRHAAALVAVQAARVSEARRYRELTELTHIGVALSTERNLLTLLEKILTQARRISDSDAGSIYLVERTEDGRPTSLKFKLSQNFSLPNLPLVEFTVPIDHASLAGYAASTGEALVIDDVYLLGDVPYRQNRSFDEKFGYRTKSMLVLPMQTHRDEVVGVLQLLNRKRVADARLVTPEITERDVVPYDQRSVELVTALASQGAVAIENSLLYEDIERLFEGFVTAAVTAIESRDPTTYGHSSRVAQMSVALAEVVDRGGGQGAHRTVRFSREQLRELRYAGLLHDFGKVGVREQVLVKQKKLYPLNVDLIRLRFAVLAQAAETQFERDRADPARRALASQRLDDTRSELDRLYHAVLSANEPSLVLAQPDAALSALTALTYQDLDGECRPILTDDEQRWLSIERGTLDEEERREIESHVTHTFRFLQRIPWTRELRHVPEIAFAHHEKLNGQGYPRAIAGDAIPVQARIMTIADIYDALTAADRPYKRAVSPEQALDILQREARSGEIDADLLYTFIGARVYVL